MSAGKYAEVRAGAEAVKPSPLVQKGMEVLHMIQVPYSEMTEAERAAVDAFGTEIQTYNVKQAAAILKCSTRTINAYLKSGRLHGVKVAGRWLITRAELERLLRGEADE